MADKSLWGDSNLFNLPDRLLPIHSRDAEFWRLHAEWRTREDAIELDTSEDDDVVNAMVEHCDEVMLPMMDCRVSTAAAVLAKLESLRETTGQSLGREISDGVSFFDAIVRDIERLAQLEIGQPSPLDE